MRANQVSLKLSRCPSAFRFGGSRRRRTGDWMSVLRPQSAHVAAPHERIAMQCGDEHAGVERRYPFGARLAGRMEWQERDPSAATRAPRRVRQNQSSGTNYAFSATAGQPQFVSWTDVSDNEIVDGFKLRERGNADRPKAGAHQAPGERCPYSLRAQIRSEGSPVVSEAPLPFGDPGIATEVP